MLDRLRDIGFQIECVSHAQAILEGDFPDAIAEVEEVLLTQTIPIEEIIGSGGGETKGTQRLRRGLAARDWRTATFTIVKTINGAERESISHKIDHVRSFGIDPLQTRTLALEIEWNNKDPFFDRDLENFKRLHAEGAISVGFLITRGAQLQNEMRGLINRWMETLGAEDYITLAAHGIVPTARQRREVMKRVERVRNPVSFRQAWSSTSCPTSSVKRPPIGASSKIAFVAASAIRAHSFSSVCRHRSSHSARTPPSSVLFWKRGRRRWNGTRSHSAAAAVR